MFNNIIYFIVVLLVFNVSYAEPVSDDSLLRTLAGLSLSWLVFAFYCRQSFRNLEKSRDLSGWEEGLVSERYQRLNVRLSILAIMLFVVAIYFFNLKQWLLLLPGFKAISVFQGVFGIALFLFYLSTIWYFAWPAYRALFGVRAARGNFVWGNVRFNLPILFPWFAITLAYDLLALTPWASSEFLNSAYGQMIFFAVFLTLLVLVMPKFIQYWWGCKPLAETDTGRALAGFLDRNHFRYRRLLSWPLFEGRMMTAGIMGIIPRYRYILVTDALMSALSTEELEAVLAHEMGHARYFHLLFYVLFFVGFMVISFGLTDVYIYLAFIWSPLADLLARDDAQSMTLFYAAVAVPMLVTLLVYFRYVMGFFMRHFERQADLYSAKLMGTPAPIINALEKVAYYSGKIRGVPNWHHFSIARRVGFLLKTLEVPRLHQKQNRFVFASFILYLLMIGTLGYTLNFGGMKKRMAYDLAGRELEERLEKAPDNLDLALNLAMVYQRVGKESETIGLYERILKYHPNQAMVLNNLAWLLLTTEDRSLRNPKRALMLAEMAVAFEPAPQFLDTLAEAFYQNHMTDRAILRIKEAISQATENKAYYEAQLAKFVADKGGAK